MTATSRSTGGAEEAMTEAEARKREVEELNEQLLVHADEIARAMDAVSNGDFTADPPRETDIEAVAAISEAFDEMTADLSGTIVDLREFAATVERTTRSVHDDLEATTDELSTLSATIEEIAANADQVSTEAGDAADAAQAGTDTAAEAIEAIEAIEGTVAELADLVESLADRTEQGASTISGIRRQLDELTRQTADLQERLVAFECVSPDASRQAVTPGVSDDD